MAKEVKNKTAHHVPSTKQTTDIDHGHKRLLQGTVVSNKMQKTLVVKVDRRVKHAEYLKYIVLSKKYKVHDEKQEAKQGDLVEIVESRPLSRYKRWALRKILKQAKLKAGEIYDSNDNAS